MVRPEKSRCKPRGGFMTGKTWKSQCLPVVGNDDCQSGSCALDGYCTPKCHNHGDCPNMYCDHGVCEDKLGNGEFTTWGAAACRSGRIGFAGVNGKKGPGGLACQECINGHPDHCGGGRTWGSGCYVGTCKRRRWWARPKHKKCWDCNCRYNKDDWVRLAKKCDRCCRYEYGLCPVIPFRALTEEGSKCWDWD